MRAPGQIARRGLGRPARVAVDAAGFALGSVLAAVAAARRGKAVHPLGVTYRARLSVPGESPAPTGADLFDVRADRDAIVRFSRSLGLPRPLPDLLGMSIRVIDAYGTDSHQDFLLVTCVDHPVLHRLLVPARDFQQRPYSSSLPYSAGGRRFIVGTLPDDSSARPDGVDELARLERAATTGRLEFGLAIAPLTGHFEHVATLHVGARLPQALDALRFNPFNTGGGLQPVGLLNRLRDYAYPLSQRAWGRTRDRGAAQRRAEAELRAHRTPAPGG